MVLGHQTHRSHSTAVSPSGAGEIEDVAVAVNASRNHLCHEHGMIAMFDATDNLTLDIAEGILDNRTPGFPGVEFHILEFIPDSALGLKEFLSEFFLSEFEKAQGKHTTLFNRRVRAAVVFDAVCHQRGFKGGLVDPACGKAIHIFTVFNAADVECVRDFPQEFCFGLFV